MTETLLPLGVAPSLPSAPQTVGDELSPSDTQSKVGGDVSSVWVTLGVCVGQETGGHVAKLPFGTPQVCSVSVTPASILLESWEGAEMAAGGGGGLRADGTALHGLWLRALPVLQGGVGGLVAPTQCRTQRDTLTAAASWLPYPSMSVIPRLCLQHERMRVKVWGDWGNSPVPWSSAGFPKVC